MTLAPLEKETSIHDSVLEFLKKNPKWLTTTEIAKQTGISRKTLEKHLQLLVFENEIYMKQWGPTRVYYPNHRIHYVDFEKIAFNNRTYWFDVMENEFGKFLVIQEKRKSNDKFVTKGSILVPLERIKKFTDSLDRISKSSRLRKFILS